MTAARITGAEKRRVMREVGRYGYFDHGRAVAVPCPRCGVLCEAERRGRPVREVLKSAVADHLPWCEASR